MDAAWIIQLHVGHDTAGLQDSTGSLNKVDTSGLRHIQCHYHLHHLKPGHKE